MLAASVEGMARPATSARPARAYARGFSLLEMVVVVVAIGILAGLALERLVPLIGQAERVAFIRVRGQLQNALMLETAQRLVRGESRLVPRMAGSNPMDYVLQAPANYLGSYENPAHEEMPTSHWYFDEGRGHLVYRVGSRAKFEADVGPRDRAEFRVQLAYRDGNGNGSYEASADIFDGVWLKSVYPYRWSE